MSLPHLDGELQTMSLRGLIFWGLAGAFGIVALTVSSQPAPSVMTLERTLGSEVLTTRL